MNLALYLPRVRSSEVLGDSDMRLAASLASFVRHLLRRRLSFELSESGEVAQLERLRGGESDV